MALPPVEEEQGLDYARLKRTYNYDDHAMLQNATAFQAYVIGANARASAAPGGLASQLAWPRTVDGKSLLLQPASNCYVQFGGAAAAFPLGMRKPHWLRGGNWYTFNKRCFTLWYRRATTSALLELHVEG